MNLLSFAHEGHFTTTVKHKLHNLYSSFVNLKSEKFNLQKVSMFPAAASLQTGFPLRSNRFKVSAFVFLFSDT
jgi:hypothetical protein